MKTIMKRKNMLVYLMITIFVLTTFTFASFAQTITENKIDLMTDGVIYPPEKGFGELFFDKNGRTQIPVRWASGVMGATLEWNPETGGIVITRGEFKVEFEIGSNVYIDNGTPKEMDTVAFVIENRTYVPIRFLAEPLGYKVDYIRNQGQVKESKRDHVVKLIYTGEVGEDETSQGVVGVADVSLINDANLKALWSQYPDHHFNVKGESYIYYQSRDNFVRIYIDKSMDGSYMISGSLTNLGEDMNASQFNIIKKVFEATVENSEELYAKFVEGYNGWYQHGDDSDKASILSGQWKNNNTSYTDGIEKWKTLGNIEYKFELGRGVEMHYRAK